MQAIDTHFLKLLDGEKQFLIPIYQRTYSWTLRQCEQLWKDIVRTATNDQIPAHFIGSVVCIPNADPNPIFSTFMIIDGQQRVTTLMLLLHALAEAIAASENDYGISQAAITERFLLNRFQKGVKKYKLLLTQNDLETLTHLVEGKLPPEKASHRVTENYKFFCSKIANCGLTPDIIYKGISKLVVVSVSLDKAHDNPQLIFESLNSTGLELSQADLIRNYVLMGLDHEQQMELYADYWHPIELSFGHSEYAEIFDRFMRDYLTIRMGVIPNLREVYQDFKHYVQKEALDIPTVVKDIYHISTYFTRMALGKEPDQELRAVFADINNLRVDVAYPFLLELYTDYAEQLLERSDFIAILRLIESYVLRRSICGIPTNSLNKTFATLAREVDKTRYLESVQAALILKDSYRRFPDDEDFCKTLLVKPDTYTMRTRNYFLAKLENHGKKEPIRIENYTIEHIMPQNENLSAAWRSMLGDNWQDIQRKYLHTLGNLTLTGYNSEYSDHAFLEKRDLIDKTGQKVGFAASPLRLNDGLGQLTQWGETEILDRAMRLAKLATHVWQYPQLAKEVLARYSPVMPSKASFYTLNDHPYLQGDMLSLFEALRQRVLNLPASVREEVLKTYIAYKLETNFVDVIPLKSKLLLTLNVNIEDIDDPLDMCRDMSEISHWGNGNVEVSFSSLDKIDDVIYLVEQAMEKQLDEVGVV